MPVSNEQSPVPAPDTLFPLSYLPAYPGSYWIYDGDTVRANETYELHPLLKSNTDNWEKCDEGHKVYLPVYNGYPLAEYTFYCSRFQFCSWQILSETENASWTPSYNQYGGFSRTVVSIDSTIALSNGAIYEHCIVVTHRAFIYGGNKAPYYDVECYAPNVGMITRYNFNEMDTPSIKTCITELTDYHIQWP